MYIKVKPLLVVNIDFLKSYNKIKNDRISIFYRFFDGSHTEQPEVIKTVMEMTQNFIKGKGDFLDEVENPNNELYFFKVDDEIQGIVELIFSQNPNSCNIYQFAVFEHGKGWGTIFYQETLKIIKQHNCNKISLWCPYEGAQIFWRKQGFLPKENNIFEKRI